MKRSKKTILLLALLVVCAGGYLLAGRLTAKQEAAATENKNAVKITEKAAEDITALSWTADGGTLRFIKTDAGWQYDADSAFPANQSTLDGYAESFVALEASSSIENVTDLSIYGLSEPAFTVTAEWSDGTKIAIALGAETAFEDGYYVTSSADSRVLILPDSPDTVFTGTLQSLAVKEEIPSVENVTRVVAGTVDASYAETSRTINTGDHWYAADGAVLDSSLVETLRDNILSVSWKTLVTALATEEELASFGLADEAVTLCLYSGDTAGRTLLIGSTDADGNYYARLPQSKMVYTVTASALKDILSATTEALSAGDALLTLPYADVTAAVFTAADKTYTLQLPAPEEETVTEEAADTETASEEETAGEEAVSTEQDEALWEQVLSLTVSGQAEAADTAVVLTVAVTNCNGIGAELVIREYDAEHYLAFLDGGSPVLLGADGVDKLLRTLKYMN